MKVIDLLNKIANGEEIPKEISYSRKCYYLTNNHDIDEFGGAIGMFTLNDEIEILDEDYIADTPTISKLYVNNELQYDLTLKENKKINRIERKARNLTNLYIKSKLNEIIDKVNGEDNDNRNNSSNNNSNNRVNIYRNSNI